METTTDNAIKRYCNYYLYSDVYPYEVVRVISPKTVEVRAMKYTQTKHPSKFLIGGFSAYCADNYAQEYSYESNPEEAIIRVRLTKRGWRLGNRRFIMEDKPVRFYDYNF